ncbi:MAG: hypothetical protein KatS3mg065_0527 [Chloroflexota bacterium]|nr:MAG: hypothetical protein KatS3mg065_0527 [Chloroflexota bacterium]
MSDARPDRVLVTRQAILDVIRAAALGSYGVTGFAPSGLRSAVLARLGLAEAGIRLSRLPRLEVDLDLEIAAGLPVAEVGRQVESAVRYAVRRAVGRDLDRLTIHVRGLRVDRAPRPTARAARGEEGSGRPGGHPERT